MLVDASVFQGGVFVALEFVHGVVHQFAIEYAKAHEETEILEGEAGNFAEEFRLELFNNILEAVFAVVRKVHEDRDTSRKLDEFVLYLFPLALVLLLFFCELLFLFRSKVVALLLLCVLDVLRFVDDGLNVGIEVAESLDVHQSLHRLRIVHQALEGSVVYIDQNSAFPPASQ